MTVAAAEIVVRPAHIRDVKSLVALIEPFVTQKILLPRTIDELALLLPNYFVAEAKGTIVGCAALEIYSSKLAELRSLVVHPDYQHHGVGHKLVQACVERAREEQVLEVMAITSAEAFFVSCGFDFTLPGQKKALFFQTRES
jgi:N-acetylglutamate synthase-like GNAT family acetyltransferase